MPTVGYQGEPGAFSDDAARALVPGAETIGYGTFDDAFAALADGVVDRAVLPVENSISGPVPRVYDLLWDEPRVTIVGELVYRVVQQLVGCADVAPSTLTEIRSHPVALEQCRRYLATVSARRAIVADTAGAIRDVVAAGDPHVAAIGSALAAQRYGGRILAASIQDVADNFTRFFLLARDAPRAAATTHACVALRLPNAPGSLRDALDVFARASLDLRTLVARPSLEKPFTYRFSCEFAEVSGATLERVLAEISGEARVLGAY